MSFDRSTLSRLPNQPGVYLMYAADDDLVYVGKATSLAQRVRSYFTGNDPRPFVRLLDDLLVRIDFVVTQNPKEALLLENTLIKKHRPRFNVMLKDDKNYLSVRIDPQAQWPRVEVTRRIRDDHHRYFGPFHSASKIRTTLKVINRYFQLRTCSDKTLASRTRPCLQYQIKRCLGPCVGATDEATYGRRVAQAIRFLEGDAEALVRELEAAMSAAAEELRFEEAADLRDQMRAIQASLVRQEAVQTSQVDRDVIGLFREGEHAVVAVLSYRGGKLDDAGIYPLSEQVFPDGELVAGFVSQYYSVGAPPPPEVLLPAVLAHEDTVVEALEALLGRKVSLHCPQRGKKRRLVELANANAREHFEEHLSHTARAQAAMEKLKRALGLAKVPRTMECYDISNFQGGQVVASQVAFRDAVPDKAGYKHLRIRTVEGQDDFASMREALIRRAKRAKKGEPMPDLIVIDGGKGQLNMAVDALRSEGVTDQAIVGLAKSRAKGVDADGELTRSTERVFVPGAKNAIALRPRSDASLLLERIRDEAHRVAITYHRKLRRKERLRSVLDEIPGVGGHRKRALLRHFGSLKGIKAATLSELEAAPGIPAAVAFSVFDTFHPGEADPPS